ncbi:MAG: hypothetical protein IPH44_24040 [Myxococcales bacterium]|nr:hypothetical protein [Myxococcales bacterium]
MLATLDRAPIAARQLPREVTLGVPLGRYACRKSIRSSAHTGDSSASPSPRAGSYAGGSHATHSKIDATRSSWR